MAAHDYYALKERCIYCDVLHQELTDRKRLVAENDDFVALAPFASRSPFELIVFPKFHSSAFSRISSTEIENLARLLRDVLQRLDKALTGPPFNLALQAGRSCVREKATGRPLKRISIGIWRSCPK